jgi:hypothetical protein
VKDNLVLIGVAVAVVAGGIYKVIWPWTPLWLDLFAIVLFLAGAAWLSSLSESGKKQESDAAGGAGKSESQSTKKQD